MMKWRYFAILFLFTISFFGILSKLFYWQIVKADELSNLGKSQYIKYVRFEPQRGEIRTSDNFPLVTNKISYLLYANPKVIKDKENLINNLAENLATDSASISAPFKLDKFWVPVMSNVTDSQKKSIENLHASGIGFDEQFPRFYPEASIAASLIGFVGKNETGENKGYFGLEGYYDRQLKGIGKSEVEMQDALGRPILTKINTNTDNQNGRTLVLHIDRTVQFLAENLLRKGVENYGAVSGMIAIMDPKTGGILAMANAPSFDPANYGQYSSDLYKNPIILNAYEPGSTFKSLVMAAGLDKGVVKPDTHCTICASPVTIGDYQIQTWNNQYLPNITMTQVIQNSDNTGMVFVGQKLGFDNFISYLQKFGIGQLTGIDLQGEIVPEFKDKQFWYPIDAATATFGQGLSVTPIQLLDAFASIANGGIRMEPHVVDKILTSDGQTIPIAPKVLNNPISEKTAKVMTEILVNAVEKGEAKWTKLKGYRIAGKTGTAQIPIAGHYDPNKTIASFIGFAPADDPKFVMLVIIDRPTTSIYGAETAAPIFFDVARELLTYYHVSPNSE